MHASVSLVFIECSTVLLLQRLLETIRRHRRFGLGGALALVALGFGGCAQSPQQLSAASHGKEYFPSSVYGAASRRVIADGQPVPRGGGQYLVGKPYTIAGRTYYPSESRRTQVGTASWYGDAFHGRLTANGEIYDRDSFTAASPTMPLPSYARVTNLRNNYSMIVRVNDRGPYASNRIMDVSRRVAESLDFKRYGTTQLKVEYVGRAGLNGSDDTKLLATLRTDQPGYAKRPPVMVAQTPVRARTVAMAEPEEMAPASAYRSAEPPRHARVATYAPERRYADDRRANDGHRYREERGTADARAMPSRHATFASVEPPRRAPIHVAQGNPPPPSRPMDLGTIPGAATPIHARRESVPLRLARARDD